MRKNGAARRSSTLDDLFAERQIYVRSGSTSRYVVVSRPLQIGVTVGAGLIVAWLAFASYSSVANRLKTAELSRELVRLETLNESLRAAAEVMPDAEQPQTLAARVPELEAALADATAAREHAQQEAEAASAEAAELRRELALAEERVAELSVVRLAAGPAASDGTEDAEVERLTRRLQTSQAEARRLRGDLEAALDDAAALRQTAEAAEANLAALQAETAQLRDQLPAAGEAGPDLAELKAPEAAPADEVAELQADLVAAETRIAALTADLEQAKSELDAAGEQPAAQLAAGPAAPEDAAAGEEELARMRAELREARQRIDELEAALRRSPVSLAPLPPPAAPR